MSQMEERIWQPGNIEVELRGVGAHVAQSGEWEFGINAIFFNNLVEQLSHYFRSLQLFQAGLKICIIYLRILYCPVHSNKHAR